MKAFGPTVFYCPGFFIRAATALYEARGAAALRHRVFVEEQQIFKDHDRDAIDAVATTLVALSTYAHEADEVVGTVRIHEAEPGLWWGSRLAVDQEFRAVGRLGRQLIRLAVSTAKGRGCDRFFAHVQRQNVPLFAKLGWSIEDEVVVHGVPHALMRADLTCYEPVADPQVGWLSLASQGRPAIRSRSRQACEGVPALLAPSWPQWSVSA
ncbi:GNAT family N-acetyltransferase [Jiella sp. MQZ9-1]|uniref:GNAT family N-acetyltransferase n=1 Tax=Jiella flava TaxID=2816857 RepID=A0A939FZ46_9HYPH|nr:MSMEG_0567/Sll0786 family nitrogen starvation N-acetyltransferase [Jiella flava]MBO0662876.1 GNAT family N-acetyltransferase [Jiella flava]MCD2471364.1 GNAT family N-acetyltransferase [Jiella flava]